MHSIDRVRVEAGRGIVGDRYSKVDGDRQITLIQAEHISALASLIGREPIHPELLRRNIVVEGINLLALKDKQFSIGEVNFQYTGLCHPCSKMEQVLGPGGYNAMRGHGGINAKVLSTGLIGIGSPVQALLSKCAPKF